MNKNKIRFFTLIEVMVALYIASLAAIAIYSTVLLVNRVMIESRVRLEAQRVSYDLTARMYRMTKGELDSEFEAAGGSYEFALVDYDDYIVPDTKVFAEGYLDITPDLRIFSGYVQCFFTEIIHPSGDGRQFGYRIDVVVQWSLDEDIDENPSYTTTVYKYFAE